MSDSQHTAEAAVLHAALDQNDGEVDERLRDFLGGELRALQRACRQLDAACSVAHARLDDARRQEIESLKQATEKERVR